MEIRVWVWQDWAKWIHLFFRLEYLVVFVVGMISLSYFGFCIQANSLNPKYIITFMGLLWKDCGLNVFAALLLIWLLKSGNKVNKTKATMTWFKICERRNSHSMRTFFSKCHVRLQRSSHSNAPTCMHEFRDTIWLFATKAINWEVTLEMAKCILLSESSQKGKSLLYVSVRYSWKICSDNHLDITWLNCLMMQLY